MTGRRAVGTGILTLALAGVTGRRVVQVAVERRVAAKLGLPRATAAALIRRMRDRLGPARFALLAARFVAAASLPGDRLVSPAFRGRIMRPFVEELIADLAGTLTYLGIAAHPDEPPCGGLLEGR